MVILSLVIWLIVFNYDAFAQKNVNRYMSFICHNLNTAETEHNNTATFYVFEFEKNKKFKWGQVLFKTNKKKKIKFSLLVDKKQFYRISSDFGIIAIHSSEDNTSSWYIDLINHSLNYIDGYTMPCIGYRNKNIFEKSLLKIENQIADREFRNYKNPLLNMYLLRRDRLQ